jgi:hypothetical protein
MMIKLPQQITTVLYYGSLIMVLTLSLISYPLSIIAKAPNFEAQSIGIYTIVQYSAMAFFMLLAWYTSPTSDSIRSYRYMIIVAIIARLLLIGVEPYSSNDVDRYLFDGRIAFEGIDPYSISHDDPSLIELREQWQPPAEHAKYVTLYPPLALAMFTLSASAGIDYAQNIWQILILLASISTVIITSLILKKANKLKHLPLVALSPILILEAGVGLHIDTFSTLAITLAIYAWQRHKLVLCGLMIGLGTLIKMLPIMLLLPLFFLSKNIRQMLKLTVTAMLTILIGYGTFFAIGFKPIGSISTFFQKWRNASPLFELFDTYLSHTSMVTLLVIIIATITIGIASTCCFTKKQNIGKDSNIIAPKHAIAMQLAVALPLFLSPVLFPWYLMPLVPLLALRPNMYLFTWLLLMPLTYEVLDNFICCGHWQPASWPVWLLGILYLMTISKLILFLASKLYSYLTQLKTYRLSIHTVMNKKTDPNR